MKKNKMKKIFYKLFKIGIIWFFIHAFYIIYDGHRDKSQSADVGIVFGTTVHENGMLSERLKARVDKSIELYRNNRIKNIIVTGGFGKEQHWEAERMKDYLIQNNIPKEHIFVDNYGNDTEKSIENTIKIMHKNGFEKAISVSQFFHQTRIKRLYKKNDFQNIDSVSPSYYEGRDVYSVFREFVAFYVEAL